MSEATTLEHRAEPRADGRDPASVRAATGATAPTPEAAAPSAPAPGATLTISQTLALDPQMGLPLRPKLPQALTPLWYSQQMLVLIGGAQPVTLRGPAVSRVLPDLLPLLDGCHTLEQLHADLPHLPARVIDDAVSLLFMRGVIEEGAMPALPATLRQRPQARDVGHWLSRYIDVTRVYAHRQALMAHMQAQRLLLLGDSPQAPMLVQGLKALGLGAVRFVSPSAALRAQVLALADEGLRVQVADAVPAAWLATQPEAAADEVDLAVLLQHTADRSPVLALNAHTLGRNAFYAVLGAGVRLGPGVVRAHSSCAACADQSGLLQVDSAVDETQVQIATERAVTMVFSMLSKFVPMQCVEQVEHLDVAHLRFNALANYRHPDCPQCERARPSVDDDAWLPWFYHAHTVHQPFQMVPKGHRLHYADANRRTVAGAFKTLSGGVARKLDDITQWPRPMLQPAGEAVGERPASIGQAVTQLIQLAAGRRTSRVAEQWEMGFRFTPSAGGMASQNLYLLNRRLDTLAPGVYLFNPNGELQFQSDLTPALEALWQDDAPGDGPAAVVVISAAHARLESKYMNTAYRYVHFDAGALLASLQWLAPSLGLQVRPWSDFNDEVLETACGMQQSTEFPAVMVAVDARPSRH